ncbi:MAG: hypothetical protein QXY49_02465 [Thermofilaceae archaeon]
MRKITLRVALIALTLIVLYLITMKFQRKTTLKDGITIYANRSLGRFKDLRGVNDGPLSPSGWSNALTLNLSEYYAKLGIKAVRFHDLWIVDEIDTIFADPEADPSDPRSYNFTGLDRCVEEALKHADLLIIRLGYDWHDPPKNKPHLSLQKLSEVAKHIVIHYTMGWANGYNYTCIWIEVWNEPDIEQFWGLSENEYFELYGAVARAIAEVNPKVKVGGPAIAYNLTFLEEFLSYVSSRGLPLDFVSWHAYSTSPEEIVKRGRAVKQLMEKFGYSGLPNVITEWNYWWNQEPWEFFRSNKVAAFQAATLILLEDTPVDIAVLYRGDAWNWGGIFSGNGQPSNPYYTWLAYKEVIETSIRVEVVVLNSFLKAIAGLADDGTLRVLVVNYCEEEVKYDVEATGYRLEKVYVIDRALVEANTCDGHSCLIGPYMVQLLMFAEG